MKDLQPIIDSVRVSIDSIIQDSWQQHDFHDHLDQLVAGSDKLFALFSEAGDACFEKLSSGNQLGDDELFFCYLLHYSWAAQAKSYLILWRDVLFQEQKAKILLLNGEITEADLDALHKSSLETLHNASAWLKEFAEREYHSIIRGKRGRQRQMAKWRLQKNPWPTYREQMAFIPKQCRDLVAQFDQLSEVTAVFNQVRSDILEIVTSCQKELELSVNTAQRAISLLDAEAKAGKEANLKRMVRQLEELEKEMVLTQHFNFFSLSLDHQLESLPEKMVVPIDVQDGMVQQLEINLPRRAKIWVDNEILPLLYEVWELTENVGNGMKMSLMNIRNRAALLSGAGGEADAMEVEKLAASQSMQVFVSNISRASEKLSSYSQQIEGRTSPLRTSRIYEPELFLAVTSQNSIGRLSLQRSKLMGHVQRWWEDKTSHVRHLIQAVEEEETLSVSERVVRYIRQREADENASPYTSIFLTKGYIGISFAVGRDSELQHVKNVVENWKDGFRGAVSITGKRLSGKSLFGELAATRLFADYNIIRLSPGHPINVHGRKFEVGHDLREALEFIRKHTLTMRPLIWLDDLELWWGPSIPLYKNVRALIEYVDDYSNQIFFMVSMGNFLKSHLQQFCQIDRIFQADIRMDNISMDAVEEAILIRHGATHKKLVDEDGQPMSPPKFRKAIASIYKRSQGNIGEALNEWAAAIRMVDENSVQPKLMKGYPLPDCLNETTGLLTAQIMLQKRTNEYHLRRQFGPAFQEKYLNVLQRLLHIGLLRRQLDGWLEVNDAVANELGRLLEQKKFLKYS